MATALSDMLGVSHVTETAGYLTAYTRFLYVTAVSGETLRPDIRAETVWHLHRQDDVAQIACHHGCLVKCCRSGLGRVTISASRHMNGRWN